MMPSAGSIGSNPYRYGGAIRDSNWFFGRAIQLQIILDRLAKHESTSLIGERRSGKTSLLFQLMNPEVRQRYLVSADDSIYVYVTPELGVRDPGTFSYEILRSLSEQGLTRVDPAWGTVSPHELRECVSELSPHKLVILLDEFDAMVMSGTFPSEFFGFLRGLAQSYDVSYVAATRDELFQCCPVEVLSSPFPNIFKSVFVGSFGEEELDYFMAETYRRSGVSLKEYQEPIVALAGMYPFFLQMASSHYFEYLAREGPIEVGTHQQIQIRFEEDARPHMEAIWNRYLSDEERQILSAMARDVPLDSADTHRLEQKGYVVGGRVFSCVLAKIASDRSGCVLSDGRPPELGPDLREEAVWLDRDSGDVWVEGKRIAPLTKLEYKLLLLLYDSRDKICEKYQIVEGVWSDKHIEVVGDSRIAKLVDRLRDKVEPNPADPRYIVTIHGRGYRLLSNRRV